MSVELLAVYELRRNQHANNTIDLIIDAQTSEVPYIPYASTAAFLFGD